MANESDYDIRTQKSELSVTVKQFLFVLRSTVDTRDSHEWLRRSPTMALQEQVM